MQCNVVKRDSRCFIAGLNAWWKTSSNILCTTTICYNTRLHKFCVRLFSVKTRTHLHSKRNSIHQLNFGGVLVVRWLLSKPRIIDREWLLPLQIQSGAINKKKSRAKFVDVTWHFLDVAFRLTDFSVCVQTNLRGQTAIKKVSTSTFWIF